ncbi:MAG: hypothetical protein HQL46_04830 [Gammaproteobacteria bacterium]|nr:hypothetical protein [Gammaproteobacteria bacterium]
MKLKGPLILVIILLLTQFNNTYAVSPLTGTINAINPEQRSIVIDNHLYSFNPASIEVRLAEDKTRNIDMENLSANMQIQFKVNNRQVESIIILFVNRQLFNIRTNNFNLNH